ncbi:MAG: hypothetical protein KAU50_02295 [Candidatus Marinimicrobia bacterium]|nr:hypothetical protein [Candidatus Neomarinimicrobiota bacterium]
MDIAVNLALVGMYGTLADLSKVAESVAREYHKSDPVDAIARMVKAKRSFEAQVKTVQAAETVHNSVIDLIA